MISIIDYDVGNLGSLKNMINNLNLDVRIASSSKDLEGSTHIILPGVGNFEYGINKLKSSPLFQSLEDEVLNKKTPILGICLGMQLLTEYSQEGNVEGLGWIKGKTYKFPKVNNLKVPHMGWNFLINKTKSNIFNNIDKFSRFYFANSYYVSCKNIDNRLSQTLYGIKFDSVINYENIYGVQFHPEKSHRFGKIILENFSKL